MNLVVFELFPLLLSGSNYVHYKISVVYTPLYQVIEYSSSAQQ